MSMTIDITPTWEELVPLLVQVAVNGETRKARETAMDELKRLARAVDEMNAEAKAQQEKETGHSGPF